MPGPRVKGKRSSAVQLRAAHVRPLQSGSLLAVRLKAADVTAAVRFRGRIWNPPLQQTRKRGPACGGVGAPRPTHRLQVGCRAACPHAAADVTAAVRFRGRIWNPPLRSCCRGRRPRRPAGSCSLKSITSRYILYSFAEFCYNGSIPFIIGHFEGVIL